MSQLTTIERFETASDRDELIVRYLPLAYRLARRYLGTGVPLEDLIQIASLGLVKAADRFDPDRGAAFASFAGPTIVGELNRYLRDCAWPLHVDRRSQQRARQTAAAQRRICAVIGRQPNLEELAEHLEVDVDEVAQGLLAAAARETVSLDAPIIEGEADPPCGLERLGGADEQLEHVPDVATVFAAARSLSRRDRVILYLRFGEDLPQTEIARRLGISQMQVSRIIRDAIARLRALTSESAAA